MNDDKSNWKFLEYDYNIFKFSEEDFKIRHFSVDCLFDEEEEEIFLNGSCIYNKPTKKVKSILNIGSIYATS